MENNIKEKNNLQNYTIYFGVILVTAIVAATLLGYFIGKNSNDTKTKNNTGVLSASLTQVSSTPTLTPTPTPFVIKTANNVIDQTQDSKVCTKYGFAQKWEYLSSYTIKEGDSLQGIARDQLKDESRVNEILKINGAGPLIVGATLYLPPSSITKSSGNLKQVYGKLIGKDSSYWKVLLSSDINGQSILAPSFIFEKVPNKDSFKTGDCIKMFLDDGYEVYTISLQ